VIGICAMDCKARSKPMRNILNKLLDYNEFETVIFGDKVILDEDVENWPVCDFFISFFSTGFPLDKAIEYVKLRKPFCVNDLPMQKILWDRRLVLQLLDILGVPTPKRLIASKDGGPKIDPDVMSRVLKNVGTQLEQTPCPPAKVEMINSDTIIVDGQKLRKPFVEKPSSGEDHNINIYYPSEMGGGGRRLFRKVSDKSSEYDPHLSEPRTDGSYIYEQFMNVDHAEDIKVYTIGPYYAHAETRKSPVVDGLVHRNNDGKEVRYVTTLTPEEKNIASEICLAFGQTVCGFDLLRVNGRSYVIDVNGWSFVKGNDDYYNNCTRILRNLFLNAIRRRKVKIDTIPNELYFENSWRLKSFISVLRHADRTPKQKMKFNFRSSPFIELLCTSTDDDVLFRKEAELKKVSRAVEEAIKLRCEDLTKLEQLKLILQMKKDLPGTKVQVKPSYNKIDGSFVELQLIVKWGGEFTHSARYQSRDAGENLRKDLLVLNRNVVNDVKIYGTIEVHREMLDDSNAAREQMENAKIHLCRLLNVREMSEPHVLIKEVADIIEHLRQTMRKNFESMNYESIQLRWCCSENPLLFRERWEKLFRNFYDSDRQEFDPSKISELYDSIKYDALHNRQFLETIFANQNEGNKSPPLIKELYRRAKILFDHIAPQEYGVENDDKLQIGLLVSSLLLKNIIKNLEDSKSSPAPCTRLYFTKGLPVRISKNDVPELDCKYPDDRQQYNHDG
ncbi:9992_t:CDS:2, partial [Acaulospora colombiana]